MPAQIHACPDSTSDRDPMAPVWGLPNEEAEIMQMSPADGFAEVVAGRLHWNAALTDSGRRLQSFHRRLVSAIVREEPLPVECEWIQEADRLVKRLRDIWAGYEEARRIDPEPQAWVQTLEFASQPLFVDWCHTLCCQVLGEPIDRVSANDGSGDEHWFSLADQELGPQLQAVLCGQGVFSPQDPIRMPWRRSA